MGGIQGIGGPPEPVNLNTTSGRSRRSENRPTEATTSDDSVQVSPEGAKLSKLAGIASEVDTQRLKRIEQARENLQNGTYKVQEVLEVVASRISKYIEE